MWAETMTSDVRALSDFLARSCGCHFVGHAGLRCFVYSVFLFCPIVTIASVNRSLA